MRTGDGRARPGISQANSGLRKVVYSTLVDPGQNWGL